METEPGKLFFGYSRVSTKEQAEHRNGHEAQRAAVDVEAERRGWCVEHLADEGTSDKYINDGFREARWPGLWPATVGVLIGFFTRCRGAPNGNSVERR